MASREFSKRRHLEAGSCGGLLCGDFGVGALVNE